MHVARQNYSPCTNCGEPGHQQRYCVAPVSSYGLILFRIKDREWNPLQKLALTETSNLVIPMSQVEFCLVQRKDSIGLIELIRGKYKLTDIEYIRDQIAGMTEIERTMVRNLSFDKLWTHVWGAENRLYRNDFEISKDKFEQLREGIVDPTTQQIITLRSLFDEIPVLWNTPEWGFPKGRRNRYETDQRCAIRECCEETGLLETQFHILQNLQPIRETFFGNNNIYYTHIYYLAWCPFETSVSLKSTNDLMAREIGDIGWFGLEDALTKIRSTNLEKREILLQASRILKNTCPIILNISMLNANGIDNEHVNTIVGQDERSKYSFIDESESV